jgi:hypothetical protein
MNPGTLFVVTSNFERMKADMAFFFFCGRPAYREEPITTGNAER